MNHSIGPARLSVVFLAMAMFNVQIAAGGPTTAARQAIQNQGKAFMGAVVRGDATAMSRIFASDAKLLVANREVIAGREAIQEFWQAALNGRLRGLVLKTVDLEGSGTFRIETGNYTTVGEGQKELDHGKYVIVWKRENRDWKIYRDIANSSVAKDSLPVRPDTK